MRSTLWLLPVLFLAVGAMPAEGQRASLDLGLESRYFLDEGVYGNPDQSESSLRIRGDVSYAWDRNRHVLTFIPYLLLSDPDGEKTHFDIREANWAGVVGDLEVRVGIGKVFWGVAESAHLVDVVNQTDLVESVDGEEKLGQPMVSLRYRTPVGDFSVFLLPYFRERTFAGHEGRLRYPTPVDPSRTEYESSRERRHVDFAARWQKSHSLLDLGVSFFSGTSRDPLIRNATAEDGSDIAFARYPLSRQVGLDLQLTHGPTLLKHESVYRSYSAGEADDFFAQVTGIEYTLYGVLESSVDLGWLAEYQYADKPNALTPFTNHVFMGARVGLNDVQGSEFLLGGLFDVSGSEHYLSIESRRRLSSVMSVAFEVRHFLSSTSNPSPFAQESHVSLELSHLF